MNLDLDINWSQDRQKVLADGLGSCKKDYSGAFVNAP